MHNANQKIQDAQDKLYLSWLEWKRSIGYDDTDESHCAEVRHLGQGHPLQSVSKFLPGISALLLFLLEYSALPKVEQYRIHTLLVM